VLLLAACGGPRDATVRVTLPDMDGIETPASGVPVVALPYNRDSLLATLERAQGTPKPNTAALDSLFAEFREPFIEHFRASRALEAIRDSAAAGSVPASAEAAAIARVTRSRAALQAARAAVGPRADSLRRAVRAWEDSTYRNFDSLVKDLAERANRKPVVDTTDATGHAELRIPASTVDWWVTAHSWDVTDPNMSWYWNMKLTGDTTALNSRSGRRMPRY
jgi:DNA-binding helix-hairpin-helix protein with protein kinase domain